MQERTLDCSRSLHILKGIVEYCPFRNTDFRLWLCLDRTEQDLPKVIVKNQSMIFVRMSGPRANLWMATTSLVAEMENKIATKTRKTSRKKKKRNHKQTVFSKSKTSKTTCACFHIYNSPRSYAAVSSEERRLRLVATRVFAQL